MKKNVGIFRKLLIQNFIQRFSRKIESKTTTSRKSPVIEKNELIIPMLNPPLLATQEDFFPEYILTLNSDKYFHFFNRNNQKFSHISWVNCLKRCFEILQADKNIDESKRTLSFIEAIVNKVSNLFSEMSSELQDEIVFTLAKNQFYTKSIVDDIEKSEILFLNSNYFVHLYLLKHLPEKSPKFNQIMNLFKEKYLIADSVEIKTHSQLILCFTIFLTKTSDIDSIKKIENKIETIARNLNTNWQFKILQAYENTKVKLPNLNILDEAFYVLANNLSSIEIPKLMKVFELYDLFNHRNVQFMANSAKYISKMFEGRSDLSLLEVNFVCQTFFTISKHDVI